MTAPRVERPNQVPGTGAHLLFDRGDSVEFILTLREKHEGTAWIRTTLGKAAIHRREIIERAENDVPVHAMDWHDIPMTQVDDLHFSVRLPLLEVGRFEAKAGFLPKGTDVPVWPEGDNTVIKVEPAEYSCSCGIYTAFVRQFGAHRNASTTKRAAHAEVIDKLDKEGYSVIPPSGTFRDLIKELDLIIGKLRYRVIQLLPIHPVPTTYARMGRFGSPFAAVDLMGVDPALAEFDLKTTPLQQFIELVDAVHARSARIFLDMPVNHTGWASYAQAMHPEWFAREPDGSFKSPEAWGVKWEDLIKLNYDNREVWEYLAGVFLFWCRHGVDGFRCDAGYMIPARVWQYVTAKVRDEFPDTIFLLEGLGGKIEVMETILDIGNMDWAYSELFQNYNNTQISQYLPGCIHTSLTYGNQVHFAETHDNTRLAAQSHAYARMRTALSAFCSHNGAIGITNGVEWFAKDRVVVHGAPPLNWGNPDNMGEHLSMLNAILEWHPAFHSGATMKLIHHPHHNAIALARNSVRGDSQVLVLANLFDNRASMISWNLEDCRFSDGPMYDLLSGKMVKAEVKHGQASCHLGTAEVLCLTANQEEVRHIKDLLSKQAGVPARARHQLYRAKALDIHRVYNGLTAPTETWTDQAALRLAMDPKSFCAEAAGTSTAPIVNMMWPLDSKRIVMIPPGQFLMIKAPSAFTANLMDKGHCIGHEKSLQADDGTHFVLYMPLPVPDVTRRISLEVTVHSQKETHRSASEIILLPKAGSQKIMLSLPRKEAIDGNCYALLTNGRGAMTQARASWGEIQSQYDCLLAANLNDNVPVDRHIMLTRCRAWVVNKGYSQEINGDCLESFSVHGQQAEWKFLVPAGMGKMIPLKIIVSLKEEQNKVDLIFERPASNSAEDLLDDRSNIRVIIRPDVEDRMNHMQTKAFAGPESTWPHSVSASEKGFVFRPVTDRALSMTATSGEFAAEQEWKYMVHHPFEQDRGIEPNGDLFSPGYFTLTLTGGEEASIHAAIETAGRPLPADRQPRLKTEPAVALPLEEGLRKAMQAFIVKRDESKTVIAGYPWFLDWGRDTLIAIRGLIAAGYIDEARSILRQFAKFEANGTLPNMIRCNDNSNRDTSDAPLWFFVACSDIVRAPGCQSFLDTDCGGRSIKDVLLSLAHGYMHGTPNGIRMDEKCGLIFSPSHFTWMDTNHPAGSPREGYPIEIQALWHAALDFLSGIEPHGPWKDLAKRVSDSIMHLYTRKSRGYLSDCLHCKAGNSAIEAVADDALRPNQLLAITLGAVPDPSLSASIVAACEELLVPGAIRSLADRPVDYALAVHRDGRLLNDPLNPYWGSYRGDEDTQRKPAYHNGTAWTWMFPSYSEALFITGGEASRKTALSILESSALLSNTECVGQIPEVLDGNAPHNVRGCGAQAWGVTEIYRVLAILMRIS